MNNHEIIGKGLLAVLAGASGNTPEEEATSILDEEEKLIAEKAANLIDRDYGEVIKQLDEYDRLEAEAQELEEEDKKYRKKIVK